MTGTVYDHLALELRSLRFKDARGNCLDNREPADIR